jgi:hypothetical protein
MKQKNWNQKRWKEEWEKKKKKPKENGREIK